MSSYKISKSNKEWKNILSDQEFHILREAGTEPPHSGEFNIHKINGTYSCKACNEPLFNSNHKFDSGCGWPSFDKSIDGKVEYVKDTSHGMIRTEIKCNSCSSHLGHVFNDGPTETGVRYCVNSISLNFKEK